MSGQIIAVTSSGHSTGKSTVAANLAFELGRDKSSVMLIDADHIRASQHIYFALQNAPTGISAACRLIQQQRFAQDDWRKLCVELVAKDSKVMLLGAVANSLMAQQIDSLSYQTMLEFFKMQFDFVVIDLANIEPENQDESVLQSGALQLADLTVLVELGEPIAIHRLVAAENQLSASVNLEHCLLVLNRVRASALGKNPQWQLDNALGSRLSIKIDHYLAEDREAFDAAMLTSVPVRQAAKRSTATSEIEELADIVRAKLRTQKVVPLLTPVSVRSDLLGDADSGGTASKTFELHSRLFG